MTYLIAYIWLAGWIASIVAGGKPSIAKSIMLLIVWPVLVPISAIAGWGVVVLLKSGDKELCSIIDKARKVKP